MVLPGTRSYGDVLPGTAASVALARRSFFPLKFALYACAQLATLFWLTAASNGVYKFVVQKNTKTTVEIELTAEELEKEIQRQKLREEQKLPVEAPHLTKEVSVMNFFYAACFGIPLLLVGGMLLPAAGGQGEPSFSFQPLATTGWCSINMDSPLRTFALFYMPIACCMFYTAAAYFFCVGEVRTHKEYVGKKGKNGKGREKKKEPKALRYYHKSWA